MKTSAGQKIITAGSAIQLLLNCSQEIPLIKSLHCRILNNFLLSFERYFKYLVVFQNFKIFIPIFHDFSRNPYHVPRYPSWETLCLSMILSAFFEEHVHRLS